VGKALREGGLTGDITGVDISSNMVDKALRSGNYVDGIVHDLDNDIAIPNTVFDLVVCTGATEMLKDPRRFLLEVYRVLKREGQAWISFQHADPEFDNPLAHQGMKQYEPEYLQKLFRECGFLVRSEKILPAAYYMPDPSGNGKLRPVPFSIWQLIRV
jgi:ubiquinone/menaquinone biosynthesis C-methylase UbiE